MNIADFVVLPSITTKKWKEQYRRVIPEALACGKVVIENQSGTPPELIVNCVFLFPEGEIKELQSLIYKLFSMPKCRVSRKGIFISDFNAFGQGSLVVHIIKQTINYLKLWPLANYFKTFGRGYVITEGDGLSYFDSVFNNYDQIRKGFKAVHLINTSVCGINPYKTAGSVALLGIKK